MTLAPSVAAHERGAELHVKVGPLPRGTQIEVRSDDGQLIGTIAPFGLRVARAGGTYRLHLRAGLLLGDRPVTLHLTAKHFGSPARPPTRREVRSIAIVAAPTE